MDKKRTKHIEASPTFFETAFKNPKKIEKSAVIFSFLLLFRTVFLFLAFTNALWVFIAIPISFYNLYVVTRKAKPGEYDVSDVNERLAYVLVAAMVWVTLGPGIIIAWAFRMRDPGSFGVLTLPEVLALAVMVLFVIRAGAVVVTLKRYAGYLNDHRDGQKFTFRRKVRSGFIKKDENRPVRAEPKPRSLPSKPQKPWPR